MNGSGYGTIPYEVDEIIGFLETWLTENFSQAEIISAITTYLDENLPGMVANAIHLSPFKWSVIEQDNYVVVAGTWTRPGDANWYENINITNSTTEDQNDAICLGHFFVPATANYTFYTTVRKAANHAKLHVLLNNVDKGYIECYNSGNLYNQLESVALGELAAGNYTLVLKAATKNDSASAYRLTFTNAIIHRV